MPSRVSTPPTRPLRFHDLRATGLTWMAVRGDEPLKIQQRAGHTDFETTQRYIRLSETIREGFVDPFPALPSELFETSSDEGFRSPNSLHQAVSKQTSSSFSGADGTRTRGLRRDRPAL